MLWQSQQMLRSLDKAQRAVHDKLSETGNRNACLFIPGPAPELWLKMQSLAFELIVNGVGYNGIDRDSEAGKDGAGEGGVSHLPW